MGAAAEGMGAEAPARDAIDCATRIDDGADCAGGRSEPEEYLQLPGSVGEGRSGGVAQARMGRSGSADGTRSEYKAMLPARLSEVVGSAPAQPVRIWVVDEHRYGLLPVIRRVWGRRGVRLHAPYATRTDGAICTRRWRSTARKRSSCSSRRPSIGISTRCSSNKSPTLIHRPCT